MLRSVRKEDWPENISVLSMLSIYCRLWWRCLAWDTCWIMEPSFSRHFLPQTWSQVFTSRDCAVSSQTLYLTTLNWTCWRLRLASSQSMELISDLMELQLCKLYLQLRVNTISGPDSIKFKYLSQISSVASNLSRSQPLHVKQPFNPHSPPWG